MRRGAQRCWALTVCCAVLTTGVVFAAPPEKIHKCAAYCKENERSNIYSPGSTYLYTYTAETDTFISGVEDNNDVSRLRITATASVHVAAPCEYVLQISDVTFVSPDSGVGSAAGTGADSLSARVSTALTAHPLSFSMHRGAVGALCPVAEDADNAWVLNFKRGLLSALQTGKGDMRQSHVSHERDVAGDCLTRFHIQPTHDDLLTVRRFKDLTQCSFRKRTHFSLPSSHYTAANSKPLIRSLHNCTQTLDNQRLVSCTCHEKHQLEPFSYGKAGAVTVVKQTLVLRRELKKQQVPKIYAPIDKRTTLLFQETVSKPAKDSKEQLFDILSRMEDATSRGVENQATVLFADLVSVLRTLNKDDLMYVIHRTSGTTRYMILDAMQLVLTDDNVSAMLELLLNGILTEGQFNSWLSSLAFNNNPTLRSIQMLTPLLDKSSKNAVLSISSMIYRYCKIDDKCLKKDAIMEALTKIEKNLGSNCEMSSHKTQDDVILALKGLGNAGLTSSMQTLMSCYKRHNLSIEVRLQALATFRRFSCDMVESHSFHETLSNVTEPAEIRIAAYLAAMHCPSYKGLYKIRGLLLKENVNQVGSFIWTHLTNIQESSAQWKSYVKNILSNENLRKKFDTNFRKYSRNYEFSSFFESLNAGGAVESNVIFSPESYVPRSAMLNLTLDLFGETINVLEIGGRADGLDDTIANMFGPEGYFPDETLSKLINGFKAQDETNDLEKFVPKGGHKTIKIPKGTVYARIFGNELNYFNFNNLEELRGSGDIFQDMLYKLFQGKDIDFMKSLSIVDTEYSVPTMIGFPLNLALNATGIVGLKIGGKINVQNFRDLKLDIAGHIVPSAAFRVVGTMLVDAFVTKAGLKIDASLNSNSYIDGSVQVDGGKLVDIKIKVPKDRMDLVKVSSELYLVKSVGQSRIVGHQQREHFQSCGSRTVAAITGMQLCTDVSYPNASTSVTAPHFPLTGPFSYVLDLKKIDNFDTYEFRYHRETQIIFNEPVHKFNLYLDTPKSNVNRKIDIGYVIYPRSMNATAKLHTPFKQYDFTGKLINTSSFKSIEGELLSNSKRAVGLKGSIKVQNDKVSTNINLQYFDQIVSEIDGFVAHTNKNKYSTFISLSGFTKEKVIFLGDLNRDKEKWDWTSKFTNAEITGDMQGTLVFKPALYSIKNTMNYVVKDRSMQSILLNVKYENVIAGMLKKIGVEFSIRSTEFPQSNADFSWGFQKTPGYLEHNAVAGIGNVIWKTNQLYRLKTLDGYHDFEVKCAFNCLNKGIDYVVSTKYLTNFKGFTAHSLAQLNAQQRVFANIEFLKDPASKNIKASLECSIPKRRWTLDGNLTHKNNEYSVLFAGAAVRHYPVEKESSFKAVGTYIDLSNHLKLDHAVTLHFTHTTEDMKQSGPWTLKGKLKFSDKNIECSASSDYEKKKYAAVLMYTRDEFHKITLTMDLAERHYDNALEFVLDGPYKRMLLDLGLEKRIYITMDYNISASYQQEFGMSLYWDKNHNPEDKCSLSISNSQGQQTFRLDYPGQSIIGISTFEPDKIKIFGHWNKDQWISFQALFDEKPDKTSISLRVKSTILNIEEESFDLSFSGIRSQSIDTHMHVKWLNNFISLNATGDYASLDNLTAFVNLNSSYHQVPNVTIDFENLLSPTKDSSTTLRLVYNEDPYLLSGKFSSAGDNCNAVYMVTGPQSILSNVIFDYSTSEILTNVTGMMTWFDKEFFMKYEQEHQKTDLVLRTPFEFIKYNAFSYHYDFQHYRSYFATEVQLLGEIFKTQTLIDHPNVHTIEGSMDLTATFLPNVDISFEHKFVGSMSEKLKIMYGENRSDLLDFELSSDRAQYIIFNVKFPGHVWTSSLERIVFEHHQNWYLKYLWNADNLNALLQIPLKFSKSETSASNEASYLLELNGTLVVHKTLLQFESDVNTFNVLLTMIQGDKYSLHEMLQYNRNTYATTNNLTFHFGTVNGELFTVNELSPEQFKHRTTLNYNDWNDAFEAVSLWKENVLQNVSIKWNRPRKLSDTTDKSAQLLYSLSTDDEIIEPKLSIFDKKYDENIEANARILITDKGQVILLSLQSSKFDTIKIEFNYDLKKNVKTSELIASWGNKIMKIYADAAMNNTLVMANAVVNLSENELMRINLSYREILKELQAGLILNQRDTYHFKGKYNFEPSAVQLLVILDTPLEDWKHLGFDMNLSSANENKYANVTIGKNMNEFKLLSSNIYTADTFEVIVNLEDALYSLPKFNVMLSSAQDKKWTMDVNWEYDEKKTNFNAEVQRSENKLNAYADIKTDLLLNGHMGIDFDFVGTDNTFGLNLILNEQFVILNGTSTTNDLDTDVNMDFSASLSNYKDNIGFGLKKSTQDDATQSIYLILTRKDKYINISADIFKDTSNIVYRFVMDAPIRNWEHVNGKIYLTQEDHKYAVGISGEANNQNFTLTSEVNVESSLYASIDIMLKSSLNEYENIKVGLAYDLRDQNRFVNIFVHPSPNHNESHELIAKIFNSDKLKIVFEAKSPLLDSKSISVLMNSDIQKAKSFFGYILEPWTVPETIESFIEGEFFSLNIETRISECDSCINPIHLTGEVQQFPDNKNYISLNALIKNQVYYVSALYTLDDKMALDLNFITQIEGFEKVIIKTVYKPNWLKISAQKNSDDEIALFFNMESLFTNNPIISLHAADVEYLILTIGQLDSNLMIRIPNNTYTAHATYQQIDSVYKASFNAMKDSLSFLNINTTLETFTQGMTEFNIQFGDNFVYKKHKNLNGALSWDLQLGESYLLALALSTPDVKIIDFRGSIKDIRKPGFTAEYELQTMLKSVEQNAVVFKFYPRDMDILVKVSIRNELGTNSLQGNVFLSPNANKGDLGIKFSHKHEQYVTLNWNFDDNSIEGALYTSHPIVKDLMLNLHRDVGTVERLYGLYAKSGNDVIDTKLKLFVNPDDYEYGRISLQIFTPFSTLSSLSIDVHHQTMRSLTIDIELNQKIYNFNVETHAIENAIKLSSILESQNPTNTIFKISTELRHGNLQNSFGSLIASLFNKYRCNIKYQIELKSKSGSVKFITMIQDLKVAVEGDYDRVDLMDKKMNLKIDFLDRIYKINSLLTNRDGSLIIMDYHKSKLLNKHEATWYAKKVGMEQQIGIHYTMNKQVSTCVLAIEPNAHGMKIRFETNIRSFIKMQNLIKMEWNFEPNNKLVLLSGDFMNNQVRFNSIMNNVGNIYQTNINLETPLNNVNNMAFLSTLKLDEQYTIDSSFIWQVKDKYDNITIAAKAIPDPQNFKADVLIYTPLADQLNFGLSYDIVNPTKSIEIKVISKERHAMLFSSALNSTALDIDLAMDMKDLAKFSVRLYHRDFNEAYLKYTTDEQITELSGRLRKEYHILNGTLNLNTIRGEGPKLDVAINLDQKNLRGTAVSILNDKKNVEIEIRLQSEDLYLKLETPFKKIKSIKIAGVYNIADDRYYNLHGQGYWNDADVYFDTVFDTNQKDVVSFKMNANVSDTFVALDASSVMTHNQFRASFNTQSSYDLLDKLILDLDLNRFEDKLAQVSILMNIPIKQLNNFHANFERSYDDLKGKKNMIFKASGYKFSIISSFTMDNLIGIYKFANLLDIPILLLKPLDLRVDINNDESKIISIDSFLNYTTAYELSSVLEFNNNKLSIRLKDQTTNTNLLFEMNGFYTDNLSGKRLQLHAFCMNNEIKAAYTLENGVLSANAHVEIPQWKLSSKNLLLSDLNLKRNEMFIDLYSEINDYRCNNSINYIRNEGKLKINLILPYKKNDSHFKKHNILIRLKGPLYIFNYEAQNKALVTFQLNEKINSLFFKYMDKIFVSMKLESHNGELVLKYDGKSHRCSYEKKHHAYSVRAESPFLVAGALDAEMIMDTSPSNSALSIKAQSGRMKIVGNFYMKSEVDKKSFILSLANDNNNITYTIDYEQDDELNFVAESSLYVMNTKTKLMFKRKDPELKLQVESDYLLDKVFAIGITREDSWIIAYIRSGDFDKNKYVRIKLYEEFLPNRFDIIVDTPLWYYMQKCNVNLTLTVEKEWVALGIQSSLLSTAYGDHKIQGTFNITGDHFKAVSNLALPIIQRNLQFKLIVPFKFSNHFTPIISLKNTVQNDEFLVYLSFIDIPELLHMAGGYKTPYTKFIATSTVKVDPVPFLEISLDTPFEHVKKARLYFNTYTADLDGHFVTNYLILNDHKIELRYALTYKTNQISTYVYLTTPFEKYDKYSLEFDYINTERKALKGKIYYPLLAEAAGIELAYLVKGFTNIDLIFNYNIPIIEDIKEINIILKNQIMPVNNGYAGEQKIMFTNGINQFGISSNTMLQNKGMSLNSFLFFENKKLNIFTEVNNDNTKKFVLKSNCIHNEESTDLLNIKMEAIPMTTMELNMEILSKQYANVKLSATDNSVTFETHNIWKSILMAYKFQNQPHEKDIYGAICWDLENAHDSQIDIRYKASPQGITSYMKIPRLQIYSDSEYHKLFDVETGEDTLALSTSSLISWQNASIGYEFTYDSKVNLEASSYKRSLSASIQLANRTLRYMSTTDVINPYAPEKSQIVDTNVFSWDALNHPEKNITLHTSWNTENIILRVIHPALVHKLETRLIRTSKNPDDDKPSSLVFELEYSPNPHDLFVIDYYHLESIDEEKSFESGLEVRHLSSHIRHGYTLNVTLDDEITRYHLELKYNKPSEENLKHIHLVGIIYRTKPKVFVYIQNDLNKLSGMFSTWSKNNVRGLTMQTTSNFNFPLIFKASLNPSRSDPSLDFNIVAGPSKSYNIHAAIPSNKEVTAYLEHDLYGSLSRDASFDLRLNTTKLLWTKIHWKNGILKEIRDNILNEYDDLQYIAENIGQSFVDFIPHDAGGRFYNDMKNVKSNISKYAQVEWTQAKQDFGCVFTMFKKVYDWNTFYVDAIAEKMSTVIDFLKASPLYGAVHDMSGYISSAYYNITSIKYYELFTRDLRSFLKILSERFSALRRDFSDFKIHLKSGISTNIRNMKAAINRLEVRLHNQLDELEELWRAAKTKILDFLEPYASSVHKIQRKYEELFLCMQRTIAKWISEIQNYIYSIQEFREVIEKSLEAWSYVKDLCAEYSLDAILDEFTKVCDTVLNDVRRIFEEYKLYCDAAIDAFIGRYPILYKMTEMSNIQNETNEVMQKITWMWNYYEVPAHWKEFLRYVRENKILIIQKSYTFMFEEVLNKVESNDTAVLNYDVTKKSIFRPDRGHIELVQSLPIDWEGFDQLPKFEKIDLNNKFVQMKNRYAGFHFETYALWLYGKLVASASVMREPPAMHALLIGSNNYKTFDGKFYRLYGDCRYLLLADSEDGDFAVFVDYQMKNNKPVKSSLIILVDSDTIQISIEGRVSINGIPRDLPYAVDERFNIHLDHAIIKIRYLHRYSLEWNTQTDVTVFQTKQWNRGKTLGLLGKADEEKYNDFSLPSGNITQDLSEFLQGWMVKTPGCKGLVDPISSASNSSRLLEILDGSLAIQEECVKVLGSAESALAGCYNIVDYEEFYKICMTERDPCLAAHAYKKMCDIHAAAEVAIPDECVTCQYAGKNMLPGEETASLLKLNTADVVFVVEEVHALSLVDLSGLMLSLEKALLEEGVGRATNAEDLSLSRNRYSVVGWGGEYGPHPYSRTIEGEVWSDAEKTAETLKQISHRVAEDNESRNVMPALVYASRLQFRPGASKTLVLIQAKECQGDEKFEDISSVLNAHDLILHILEPDVIKPRSGDHKSAKVFGLDQNGAFTIRHIKGAMPDVQSSNKVSIPRDQCTPAAFESGGSLFDLDHALPDAPPTVDQPWPPESGRPGLDGRFGEVWAHRVASGMRTAARVSCECMRDVRQQRGLLVCRRSESASFMDAMWDMDMSPVAPMISDEVFAARSPHSLEYSDESFI